MTVTIRDLDFMIDKLTKNTLLNWELGNPKAALEELREIKASRTPTPAPERASGPGNAITGDFNEGADRQSR